METQHFTDLATEWFSLVETSYNDAKGKKVAEATDGGMSDPAAGMDAMGADPSADGGGGELTGAGWVIQLTGYHYHNSKSDRANQTGEFVKNTLIKNLEEGTVRLPDGENGELIDVPMQDLAISHVWLVRDQKLRDEIIDPDAVLNASSASGMGGYGAGEGGYGGAGGYGRGGEEGGLVAGEEEAKSKLITLRRYDFIVQFVWQPRTRAEREELALERERAAEEAAAAKAAEAESGAEAEVEPEN